MEPEVLYEDQWCVAVNKPHNCVVHQSKFVGTTTGLSLVEIVRQSYPSAVLVHRLDNKTAGIVLFAKEAKYITDFQQIWNNKDNCQKRYLALVRGHLMDDGTINSPVKNERGNYKEAETHFRTLLTLERPYEIKPYPTARYSIVEFSPTTGRWHQIRLHANKIAHPIIGDPKHGNRHHNHYFIDELNEERLFLQAFKLEFFHPFLQQKILIQVKLSEVFLNFLTEVEIEQLIATI